MTVDERPGNGHATVVVGDVQFDQRDAALLGAIAEHGSVNRAAKTLGRSHARALKRLDTLEDAFGELVERTRGGAGGGGSTLTDRGRNLLDRYDRLAAAVTATASMRETVLQGTISGVRGELAEVDTPIGTIQGLHEGLAAGDSVQARIPSDAITVHLPDEEMDPDATSARNRRRARVDRIESGETIHWLSLTVDDERFHAIITANSLERLELTADMDVIINWKATATRLIPTHQSF